MARRVPCAARSSTALSNTPAMQLGNRQFIVVEIGGIDAQHQAGLVSTRQPLQTGGLSDREQDTVGLGVGDVLDALRDVLDPGRNAVSSKTRDRSHDQRPARSGIEQPLEPKFFRFCPGPYVTFRAHTIALRLRAQHVARRSMPQGDALKQVSELMTRMPPARTVGHHHRSAIAVAGGNSACVACLYPSVSRRGRRRRRHGSAASAGTPRLASPSDDHEPPTPRTPDWHDAAR